MPATCQAPRGLGMNCEREARGLENLQSLGREGRGAITIDFGIKGSQSDVFHIDQLARCLR